MRHALLLSALAAACSCGAAHAADVSTPALTGLTGPAGAEAPVPGTAAPWPECAGIPLASDMPFYDYEGLSGSYGSRMPFAEGQPITVTFALLHSQPYAWSDGNYSGLFMAANGTMRWRYGKFAAVPVNPAASPGIVLQTDPLPSSAAFMVLGLLKSSGTGHITALCLYDARHPWPPTVFPQRPFTLRRLSP
ncbi:hypothetical protein [Eleftheria terrae]|uniref:hypothetical protein n=1 Tax=Eleftheria terrae TaxID=1597781 RepID=UPI00263A9600|nr:hypothetical protein [Eleftheria terrae]WKB53067.1 hypothetical protein N7L95_01285 [Eleftheria terrae]